MPPVTLRGVIAKLFRHFCAFKESMTLNLAQGSFKVVYFGGSRKPVYIDFIWAAGQFIVTFARSLTVSDILPVLYAQNQFFRTPLLFRLKFRGCCLWNRSVMLGSAERGKVRLISHEIIFPRIPTYVITIYDGRSDNIAVPRSA